MKTKLTKYFLSILATFVLSIIYLSVLGLETERFNKQIKKKLFKLIKI